MLLKYWEFIRESKENKEDSFGDYFQFTDDEILDAFTVLGDYGYDVELHKFFMGDPRDVITSNWDTEGDGWIMTRGTYCMYCLEIKPQLIKETTTDNTNELMVAIDEIKSFGLTLMDVDEEEIPDDMHMEFITPDKYSWYYKPLKNIRLVDGGILNWDKDTEYVHREHEHKEIRKKFLQEYNLVFFDPNVIKLTPLQLATKYNWEYNTKDKEGNIYYETSHEYFAEQVLAYREGHKDVVINQKIDYDNYYNYMENYTPNIESMFKYTFEEDTQKLVLKEVIEELGGIEDFMLELDLEVGEDDLEGDTFEDIFNYFGSGGYYGNWEKLENLDSETLDECQRLIGYETAQAHARENYTEIMDAFYKILDDNGIEIDKKYTEPTEKIYYIGPDDNKERKVYMEDTLYYRFKYIDDWAETIGGSMEDWEDHHIEEMFIEFIGNTIADSYLDVRLSDYGTTDDKQLNKDIKSEILDITS